MSALRNRLAFALAAGALLPAGLYAQQSTGSLSGRVTETDGVTPKAGVQVTVIQKGTNLTRKTVSDDAGNWRTPALPVGDYRILLAVGSAPPQVINRAVNLGMDTLVRFRWPAEAGATVIVEAAAMGVDQVNTTSAEIGVTVDSQVLANMPILDRNVNSAAVLAPGVQIIQGSQVDPTKKTSTYIVSGEGQGRGTNFNVDGADNNSSDVGGYVLPIPMDAIAQFQVVTNQYKAEFGRSNAGFLNVVTKSGTNEFEGVASYQYTDQTMRARRTDEGNKKDNDSNVMAFTVSGPIILDKLFYMVSVEKETTNTGLTFNPIAVSTYSSLGSAKNKLDKMNLNTKVDWNISENWLAAFHYARYYDESANQTFPHADAVGGFVDPSMLGTNRDSTTSYGAKLTATFGQLVWESTFNIFDYKNSIRPSNPGQNNGTGLELRSRHDANAEDAWRMGQDPNAFQNTGVKRTQWKNEVTFTAGEHAIKGGVDWQKTEYPLEKYFWDVPTVYVMSMETPLGVTFQNAWDPSITVGQISRAYLTVPSENAPTTFNNWGLYIQDEWTINPKWSVYGGLRMDWDTQLDYYSRFDDMYSQIHNANPQLAGIGSQAPRTHHYGSPRVQILYKPNGDDNLTFKLGFGRFVASTIDNVVGFSRALSSKVNGMPVGYVNNTASHPFTAGSIITTVNGTNIVLPADLTPYNYANNINSNPGLYQYGLRDLFGVYVNSLLTPASFSTGGKQLLASNFAYPTTETLSFGVTYKFSERSALDVTFLYSKTKNLTTQFVTDASSPYAWSNSDPTNTTYVGYHENADREPLPSSADTDQGDTLFLSNQKSSSKQLQVKWTYATQKMKFLATFVAKEFKSTAGGSGGAFDNQGQADFYGTGATIPWETSPERPAAGTEAFSGSFSWTYAFDFGTQVGLLGQWHSGKYYDVFLGYAPHTTELTGVDPNDPQGKGYYPDPYGPGGGTDVGHPNPVIGTDTGDWAMDLGLRVSHQIKFGRKMILEPYIQASNLLNNYDYGTAYQNQTFNADGSFNTLRGTRLHNFQSNGPRTVAFGARFTW